MHGPGLGQTRIDPSTANFLSAPNFRPKPVYVIIGWVWAKIGPMFLDNKLLVK